MRYEELIKKVLGGKSVNARAKELGVPQKTMDNYVKAVNLPDCDGAIVLARAAGVSIEEAVLAIAAKKAELRPARVHSFLRPAMASVLSSMVAILALIGSLATPSDAYAIDGSNPSLSARILRRLRNLLKRQQANTVAC